MSNANPACESLKMLENRAYATYRVRLLAHKRLKMREHSWNTFLIATAIATTLSAIALLRDDQVYGPHGDVLMVCVAVLSLSASLVVPTMNYAGRARDMKSTYRRIQRLSAEIELARLDDKEKTEAKTMEYFDRYQALLDESENHTQGDHQKYNLEMSRERTKKEHQNDSDANGGGPAQHPNAAKTPVTLRTRWRAAQKNEFRPRWWIRADNALTLAPYIGLSLPIALVLPILGWISIG